MKFTIRITTGLTCDGPVDNFNPGKGLDIINIVRDELNMPDLEASKIDVDSRCYFSGSSICIKEEDTFAVCGCEDTSVNTYPKGKIVEHIQQFEARNDIYVHVPPGYIGRYFEMKVKKNMTNQYGGCYNPFTMFLAFLFTRSKLSNVDVEYKFNEQAFLADWVIAGCPDYWHCDKEDITTKEALYQEKLEEKHKLEEAEREVERKEREAMARDKSRTRLQEYSEDLAMMAGRLDSIVKEYTR